MRLKKHVIVVFSVVLIANAQGQDVHFSQYYASPIFMNPGTTGSFDGKMRAAINYRNQWLTVGKPYSTYSASYEIALLKKKQSTNYLGIGLNFLQDKAGLAAFKRTEINLALAYNAQLNEANNIALGIQGGYDLRSIDKSELTWDEQYEGGVFDPSRDSGEDIKPTFGYVDFAAGLLWRYVLGKQGDINVGFGAAHLTQPKQQFGGTSLDKLPMKFTIHGEGRFTKRMSDLAYYPNFLVALQGPNREINAGIMFRYMMKESSKYTSFVRGNSVHFGANYRLGDAVIVILALELADWKIGLSYDITVSKFTTATSSVGGFEITLVYMKAD